MYQQLLTNRYLASRIIPLIAVAAVGLCVALVIIVISVMSGFLDMVRESGRTLMGDVVISRPIQGLPYYEELIAELESLDEVDAASPLVDSWGLLQMPYPHGPDKQTKNVQVWGIDIESFSRVTDLDSSLYWQRPSDAELAEMAEDDPRRIVNERDQTWDEIAADTQRMHQAHTDRPGAILGIHVSDANYRDSDGTYRIAGNWWMPNHSVTLAMLPTAEGVGADVRYQVQRLGVVNEFMSGVHLIDRQRILIPLDIAQRMADLDAAELTDPDELDELGMPKVVGRTPARATKILLRAADGATPETARDAVRDRYIQFARTVNNDPDRTATMPPGDADAVGAAVIQTWEQQQAQFIGPVEKERELMRTLFMLVYLICAALVLSIFWAIVYEKTRDIGILRSIGASRMGIVGIFLRYGLTIGVVGAFVGFGLGALVVRNINLIHDTLSDPPLWLAYVIFAFAAVAGALTVVRAMTGRLLPIMLGTLVTLVLLLLGGLVVQLWRIGGVVVWDPSVYYFDEIPSRLDMQTVITTMIGGVIFSLLGAVLPAAKAADTDPVQALRYE